MLPSNIQYIPIHLIDPDPNQPRKSHDPEALQRLAVTIAKNGVEVPICVRTNGERFAVIWGERRWRAAQIAGLEAIPSTIDDRETTAQRKRIRQLLENTGRESLLPLEIAEAIEQAISDGMTAAQVAAEIGLSEGQVSKLRKARRELSGSARAAVASGKLGLKAAYTLAGIGDAVAQDAAANEAVLSQLSAEQLARKIRKGQRGGRDALPRTNLNPAAGCRILLAGREWSMASIAELFAKLAERARQALGNGLSPERFAASLRPARPVRKATA